MAIVPIYNAVFSSPKRSFMTRLLARGSLFFAFTWIAVSLLAADASSVPSTQPASLVPASTSVTLTIVRPSGGYVKGDTTWPISCGSEQSGKNLCVMTVPAGSTVTLTAVPDTNFRWISWIGICDDTQEQRCIFSPTGDRTVRAYFGTAGSY